MEEKANQEVEEELGSEEEMVVVVAPVAEEEEEALCQDYQTKTRGRRAVVRKVSQRERLDGVTLCTGKDNKTQVRRTIKPPFLPSVLRMQCKRIYSYTSKRRKKERKKKRRKRRKAVKEDEEEEKQDQKKKKKEKKKRKKKKKEKKKKEEIKKH